jgi:hypothetical protein
MYERSGNMNSVTVSLISVFVSALVSLIGFFITYTSTGKKLEDHKKLLEAKGASFEQTMKLYKKVNVIAIDLSDGELDSYARCANILEPIRSEYNMNEIFIPKKVSQSFKCFICDFGSYVNALESYEDTKKQGIQEATEYQEKTSNANEEANGLREKVLSDFSDLRKEIKIKFTMFD